MANKWSIPIFICFCGGGLMWGSFLANYKNIIGLSSTYYNLVPFIVDVLVIVRKWQMTQTIENTLSVIIHSALSSDGRPAEDNIVT